VPTLRQAGPVILAVEDLFIVHYLDQLLTPHGYAVIGAGVRQAAALLGSGESGVSLLISNAPEEFLEFAECIPVVYLSSAPDPSVGARLRACRTVRKPFRAQTLLEAIEELAGAACGTGASACQSERSSGAAG
jgi:hypothetical protein